MKRSSHISIFIVDDDKLFTGILKNEVLSTFAQEDMAICVFEAGEQCEPFVRETARQVCGNVMALLLGIATTLQIFAPRLL